MPSPSVMCAGLMLSTLSLLPDLQEWQMDFLVSLCLVVQICPICAGTQLFLVAYSFFLFQVPGRDVCPGAKHCRTAAKGQRFQRVLFSGGFCAWRFRIGFLGILGTFFFFLRFVDTHPFPPSSSLRREMDTEQKVAYWDIRCTFLKGQTYSWRGLRTAISKSSSWQQLAP